MDVNINDIKDFAINIAKGYGPSLVKAIVIFYVGKFVANMIRKLISRIGEKKQWDPSLYNFLGDISYTSMLAFVIISVLGQLGVQTNSFVAIIGAAGLAVGFALQGSLSNFAAGVMIIIFKPYKIGDFIEGGGVTGSVEKIQIFNTILKSPDNKTIIVQNSGMTGSNIINYSTKPTRRIDMTFGIGYNDDIDKARELILDTIKADSRILSDPEPMVVVSELADSSVNFFVRPWVNSADYWGVFFSLNENIKKVFDKNNISIPFPQQDVHLYKHESA